MRYAVAVLLGTLMGHSDVFSAERLTVSSGPIVIYAPGESPAGRKTPTQVGLYTPELPAALAQESPGSVSARVRNAVREETPIVVLWSIPPVAAVMTRGVVRISASVRRSLVKNSAFHR